MHQKTHLLLLELANALNVLNLWQAESPSQDKLSSTAPFCCDTLSFEQWLQFVFIERIGVMIENKLELPSKIHLSPMAEEAFKHLGSKASPLLSIINDIDMLLQGGHCD
jgi:uncharacterized protein YqcC (DUF446 family)